MGHFLFQKLGLSATILGSMLLFCSSETLADPATPPVQQPMQLTAGTVFRDCADCPEMVVIPAGSFDMGSNKNNNEQPIHHVTISKTFSMGKTEVTQGQWKLIMGNNPSLFRGGLFKSGCGDTCPVERISWDDVHEFVQKLNDKTGKEYRLPSEAEWEYACRAGGQQEYCGSDHIDDVAWYGAFVKGNSGKSTNPVATKQANAWGLYDMSGNVFEWVEDSYHDNYDGAPTDGSVWEGDGAERVIRGGSWQGDPLYARAAFRLGFKPTDLGEIIGFRLARTLP